MKSFRGSLPKLKRKYSHSTNVSALFARTSRDGRSIHVETDTNLFLSRGEDPGVALSSKPRINPRRTSVQHQINVDCPSSLHGTHHVPHPMTTSAEDARPPPPPSFSSIETSIYSIPSPTYTVQYAQFPFLFCHWVALLFCFVRTSQNAELICMKGGGHSTQWHDVMTFPSSFDRC